jgi:hypothetical protein
MVGMYVSCVFGCDVCSISITLSMLAFYIFPSCVPVLIDSQYVSLVRVL